MSTPMTVGWCPGALRPMATGDGLVLRVKPRGGRLTLDQADTVAALALRFGNGHLDLTGRANLQIRGVRTDAHEPLAAGLREAGLLDPDAAIEARRNIVASPLAGLDPTAHDIDPFLKDLEACLAADRRLQALPAKWSIVVDGGGRLPLAGVSADLRFRFAPGGTVRIGLADHWSEELSGVPDLAALLADIVELAAPDDEPLRMAALLAREGADMIFARLRVPRAAVPPDAPPSVTPADLLALTGPVMAFGPPFGAITAETLTTLVAICRVAGVADLRLTPWRVLLATGVADRDRMVTRLAGTGLILDGRDPRLRVSACVGAPACHRATTPARTDAADLATRVSHGLQGSFHVSACAKACARPADATWTLIARAGLYDVVQGRDPLPRVTGLSFAAAANWLSRAGGARIL